MRTRIAIIAVTAAAGLALPAAAQDQDVAAQDQEFALPEQCQPAQDPAQPHGHGHGHGPAGDAGMGMGMMTGDLSGRPEHVQENMRRMAITMPAMHQGMLIEDPDVAFACGMIAHHQGAIDMAEVVLAHGDDPEMRALAEEIIEAQVGEIAEMTEWLARNAR